MVHKVVLPKFDANITEATLGRWHKAEGDAVEKGDVLVDVVTDKANFELTAEAAGTLRRILAPERSQIPLQYVLALVGEPEEPLPDVLRENDALMEAYRASLTGRTLTAPSEEGETPGEVPPTPTRIRATPRARRLAREHGVDLADVPAKPEQEVLSERDVQDYLEEKSRDR